MCNVIVIPAYEPDERLIGLLESLERSGSTRIVVTDDGSGPLYTPVFIRAGELGCVVVRHEHNLGKGAAIKTGIEKALREFGPGIGIITADADGQHLHSVPESPAATHRQASEGSLPGLCRSL